MEYEHAGGPVAGGTYPAEIFHDFMSSWIEMREQRRLERAAKRKDDDETDSTAPALPIAPSDAPSAEELAPTETAPTDTPGQRPAPEQQAPPQQPAPEPEPAPTPAPAPTTPPSDGGGGGAGPGADG
jgi:hypothetical protein